MTEITWIVMRELIVDMAEPMIIVITVMRDM